ncbi:hypothetical protein BD408DRAFT_414305, partial [Parasitella parasitica]
MVFKKKLIHSALYMSLLLKLLAVETLVQAFIRVLNKTVEIAKSLSSKASLWILVINLSCPTLSMEGSLCGMKGLPTINYCNGDCKSV